jgi:hypothetical protein
MSDYEEDWSELVRENAKLRQALAHALKFVPIDKMTEDQLLFGIEALAPPDEVGESVENGDGDENV